MNKLTDKDLELANLCPEGSEKVIKVEQIEYELKRLGWTNPNEPDYEDVIEAEVMRNDTTRVSLKIISE